MEILSPQFLKIVFYIAAAFTVLSFLQLLLIIFLRWLTDRRLLRAMTFRKRAQRVVSAYQAHTIKIDEVTRVLKENPPEALGFLMNVSDYLPPKQRPLLAPLFQAMPFAEKELRGIEHRHWEVRRNAAERLGYFGDASIVPALEKLLHDETLEVRFAAARALVRLGDIRAMEQVLQALDIPGEMVQRRVAEILFDLGAPAIEPLLAILETRAEQFSENARTVMVRLLGMLHAREAVPTLTRLLKDPDVSLRVNAVRSLATIGDRTCIPAICEHVKDEAWEVRTSVMHALGRLQATEKIPGIVEAMGDPVWWVRFASAQALYSLGKPGIQALQNGMQDHADRYAREMCRQILQEHKIQDSPLPSP
jgi:HEAT repeat protein